LKKILAVVAHPDDEVLGCGATLARLIKEDYEANTLILGEGATSRDKKRETKNRNKEILALKEQAKKANRILGVKEVFFYDLPDNRFDTLPLLEIIKAIEEVKIKVEPDIIFTHYGKDLNIDHQITYNAVITAARPIKGETVKEIYSFEIPSSTEWGYPLSFSPNVFFDVTGTIDLKLKAMSEYETELKNFPHPRSLENIKLNAKHWGVRVGLKYAEAFKTIRVIK
jgi:LmbE family N-acetylglucosaminyl deacetylase